jgi:hypothetical protein
MAWSFAGVSFAVVSEGPIEVEWFRRRVATTVDPIVGSSSSYVDIGATTRDPMTVTAQVTATATRDSLEGLIGQSGTLTDDASRSCTALLVEATPVRVKNATSGIYRVQLTFVFVS